jgi:phage tail sheath protein FI
MRPPGVYPGAEEPRARALSAADTRVAGFVGLCEKGPLDEPRLVGGWGEFVEIFGNLPEGYLSKSVEGFFRNGGRLCYIVRIAHRARAGVTPGPEHAACAEWICLDGWGKSTLRVSAVNEGRWGNDVWARCEQVTAAQTLLTLDLDVGSGEARVNSARGFERGMLVRIHDRENSDFVTVTEVDDRTLRWGPTTPVNHPYRAAGPTTLEVLELDVYASLRNQREAFRGLQLSPMSRRCITRVVNEGSRLIRIEDLGSASPMPHNLPVSTPAVRLTGGRDGTDTLSVEDFVGYDAGPADRAGLTSLAGVEAVAMLSVPDAMLAYRSPGPEADLDVQRIQDAMVLQCETLRDRFALLDAPPTRNVDEVRRWRHRYFTSFAALYYPWLTVDTIAPRGGSVVPPSGHVAGVYARCDTEVGVHKAPANEVIVGATGVIMDLREDDLGALNNDAINAIRALPGRGVRPWGARTLSDDPDWRYINVRRLFIMLRRSIEQGTRWAVFEPNGPSTWEVLSIEVSAFLKRLFERGAFAGGSPEESFFVRCNEQTNPPELIAVGQLNLEVGVAPAVPAEYLIFNVAQSLGDEYETVA